jgi:hypothetical protein
MLHFISWQQYLITIGLAIVIYYAWWLIRYWPILLPDERSPETALPAAQEQAGKNEPSAITIESKLPAVASANTLPAVTPANSQPAAASTNALPAEAGEKALPAEAGGKAVLAEASPHHPKILLPATGSKQA